MIASTEDKKHSALPVAGEGVALIHEVMSLLSYYKASVIVLVFEKLSPLSKPLHRALRIHNSAETGDIVSSHEPVRYPIPEWNRSPFPTLRQVPNTTECHAPIPLRFKKPANGKTPDYEVNGGHFHCRSSQHSPLPLSLAPRLDTARYRGMPRPSI